MSALSLPVDWRQDQKKLQSPVAISAKFRFLFVTGLLSASWAAWKLI